MKNELQKFYDKLCAALTNYENDDGSGDAGDAGERLYLEVVWIVNSMAEKIN